MIFGFVFQNSPKNEYSTIKLKIKKKWTITANLHLYLLKTIFPKRKASHLGLLQLETWKWKFEKFSKIVEKLRVLEKINGQRTFI